MRQHNAPGLQFALTDLHGSEYIASYGMENIEAKQKLTPEPLFQIGSISKSMAAVLALQLVEDGRLDLHRPVMEYLPWLPWMTDFGAVSTHHILTHTSGMPGGGSLFFPSNRWTHLQRYDPGTRYFYSNMAFNVVGQLVEQLGGQNYQDRLKERIFRPVGMNASSPVLGGKEWKSQSVSYIPARVDTKFQRFDPLREAPSFHEDTSAGCVASTPTDMARYLRCLLRGGVTDNGDRILSEKSFQAMSSRYIEAPEWGPGAGYGYGIGVNSVQGDQILLHTGGMVSFMSAMYLNLSHGVAAFASINAQQGYRPMPVARFATELLLATQGGGSIPAPIAKPTSESPLKQDAPDSSKPVYPQYAGTYVNDDPWGGTLNVAERDGILSLNGTPLAASEGRSFYVQEEPQAPNRCAFECIVGRKAQILLLNGTEYRRFNADYLNL